MIMWKSLWINLLIRFCQIFHIKEIIHDLMNHSLKITRRSYSNCAQLKYISFNCIIILLVFKYSAAPLFDFIFHFIKLTSCEKVHQLLWGTNTWLVLFLCQQHNMRFTMYSLNYYLIVNLFISNVQYFIAVSNAFLMAYISYYERKIID